MAGNSSAASELTPKTKKHSSAPYNVKLTTDLSNDQKEKLLQFAYQELLLELVLDAVFEYDRLRKKEKSVCGACGTRCRSFLISPSKDIFGRDLATPPSDKCECIQCGNFWHTTRYAPHLEKCLGMGRTARPKKSLLE